MPTDAVCLVVAAATACSDAGIPLDLAASLIWTTRPRDRGVRPRQWKTAREVFAAELRAGGWTEDAVAGVLGVSAMFVRVSVGRYGSRDELEPPITRGTAFPVH